MGLDMYLEKHSYVRRYDPLLKRSVCAGKVDIPGVQQDRVKTITEEIGYWRKANHIHAWFIDNCADNKDDNCRDIYVERAKLQELLGIVREVMANHALAPELLPTRAGFFFGGTDYDEWYFQDLIATEKILVDALADEGGDIYYRASW